MSKGRSTRCDMRLPLPHTGCSPIPAPADSVSAPAGPPPGRLIFFQAGGAAMLTYPWRSVAPYLYMNISAAVSVQIFSAARFPLGQGCPQAGAGGASPCFRHHGGKRLQPAGGRRVSASAAQAGLFCRRCGADAARRPRNRASASTGGSHVAAGSQPQSGGYRPVPRVHLGQAHPAGSLRGAGAPALAGSASGTPGSAAGHRRRPSGTSGGMAVSPEQIVIGAGAEYLYLLLAQLLGRDTVFAVEDPGYPKIRQVYGALGAACVPVRWTVRALTLTYSPLPAPGRCTFPPTTSTPPGW